MNDFIKINFKWKNQIYRNFIKNDPKNSDYVKFQKAIIIVSEVISRCKE